ncbi:FAD-binding oxidoreductase [Actinoplanes sp. CA-054009]
MGDAPGDAGGRPGAGDGADAARALRSGVIVHEGDPGYEQARVDRIFNRRLPARRPAAIVKASTEQDVIGAVRLARERGWQVVVRSGGHSWAQWSLRDEAVVIDLGGMREVTYDQGVLRVSPSVKGGSELAPYLAARGRFFPGGHCPTVGLGGFLLQGGQGWNARGRGWAAEYIEGIDVVTADGSLVHASPTSHEDLFWAARGAGPGFFGVVTRFYLRTIPAPEYVAHTVQAYRLEDFDEVMTWLQGMHGSVAPSVEIVALTKTDRSIADEPILLVTAVALISSSPSSPSQPSQPSSPSSPSSLSEPSAAREADAALAPFRTNPALSRALMVIDAQPTTLERERARQLEDNPEGHRWAVDNAWLSGPASEVVPASRRVFTTLPNDKSFTIWFSMAPLRTLPDMAFSLQSEIYLASYVLWESPADDARFGGWQRDAMAELDPVSVGQYLGDSDLSRPVPFLAPAHAARLAALRDKWDPDRVFPGYGLSGASTSPTSSSRANSH